MHLGIPQKPAKPVEPIEKPDAKPQEEVSDPPLSPEPNLVPVYLFGGMTIAALGTSAVLRGMANGQTGEDSTEDERDRLVATSNAALITGSVFAGATVGYLIYALVEDHDDAQVQTTLAVDSRGGSITFGGTF